MNRPEQQSVAGFREIVFADVLFEFGQIRDKKKEGQKVDGENNDPDFSHNQRVNDLALLEKTVGLICLKPSPLFLECQKKIGRAVGF